MALHYRWCQKGYIWCGFSTTLLVDVGDRLIMDTFMQLNVQDITSDEPVLSPILLHRTPSNRYEAIVSDCLSLTKPHNKEQWIKHDVTHHINTTGPLVSSRTRWPPPEWLKIAHQEFDHMMQLGIAHPSSSSWSSPLNMDWYQRKPLATAPLWWLLSTEFLHSSRSLPHSSYTGFHSHTIWCQDLRPC